MEKDTTTLKQKIILLTSSFILSLLIVEAGLRLLGIIYLSRDEFINRRYLSKMEGYRILCLGESTTGEGEGSSYPSQLEKILNRKITSANLKVINKGVPGTTSSHILMQLEDNLNKYRPDMVVVMMGINDISEDCVHAQDYQGIRKYILRTSTYKLIRFLRNALHKKAALGQIFIEVGNYYYGQGYYTVAEGMYMKALEIFPKKEEVFLMLGQCYYDHGRLAEAEDSLKKAIEANPKLETSYYELALNYHNEKKYLEAEGVFKKGIAIAPRNEQGYIYLGWTYHEEGKLKEAEEVFRKAIEINPSSTNFIEIGTFYESVKDYPKAQQMFKKSIETEPGKTEGYIDLGKSYYEEGKFAKTEEMFKKAIEVNPQDDNGYLELESFYRMQERTEEAGKVRSRFIEVIRNTDNFEPMTIRNYRKLKNIVLKRGIKLVCVQYPLRSLKFLKVIFDSTEGVVFVDNEEIFKKALQKGKYDDYFIDEFAGDFGHCTPMGNQVLAENIADVLIRDFFSKGINDPDKK